MAAGDVVGAIRFRRKSTETSRREAAERKSPAGRKPLLSEVQTGKLIRLFREGDSSQAELARRFCVHVSVVARTLLKAGLR